MSSRRAVTIASALVGIVAAGVLLLPGYRDLDYQLALQFTVAVFFVDLLDLQMPYGEPVPVDTALVVACLILGGPATAMLCSVVGRIAVYAARRSAYRPEQIINMLARRAVSIALCALVLELTQSAHWSLLVQSVVVGSVLIITELLLAQVQAAPVLHERVSQLFAGNVELQGSLLAAQLSIAALIVLTYGGMGVWALVLMVLLVLLMRQSLALVLEIRQAYRGTIEALVAAIEIQDPKRRGHARRVEHIARLTGLKLGIRGRELERLGYAALLHDVDLIGVDPHSSPDAGDSSERHAADVVSEVGFLAEVSPVLRICDGQTASARDAAEAAARLAAIVSLASDIDDAIQTGASVPGSACRRVTALLGAHAIEEALAGAREAGVLRSGNPA